MGKLSVVIADDHEVIRAAVRSALESARPPQVYEVVAEVDNGLDAVVSVRQHLPDLLVLDLSMPLASGAEIVPEVMRRSPDTNIVVLTGVVAPALLAAVVDQGVRGIFSKTASLEVFIDKLPLIVGGGHFVAPELVQALEQGRIAVALTPRELQTLNMMVRGKSNKEMAVLMHLSPKTVEKHRGSLMRKLGARSTAELLARALQDGLIEAN